MTRTLNLGILAHVDAGKTSLTERLLYAAGVIDEIGSVDAGTTQTDTLELERQRGITIKAAVVSFVVDDVTVNLIDTPGHPDFIAEVERVLGVLDGAVLVISAVEGVQSQTRVLMRTLIRLGLPVLLFVNKIDRRGADAERVLDAIARKLTPAIVAIGHVSAIGTREASFEPFHALDPAFCAACIPALADHDDTLLSAYVGDQHVAPARLARAFARQSRRAFVHPVLFGSAITGAGVEQLTSAIVRYLPAIEHDANGPVSGSVFKVERGSSGEKIAYARMFSGTVHVRDRIRLRGDRERKITAIDVFERGGCTAASQLVAGHIGKLKGLHDVQIGDAIGLSRELAARRHFAPPTLETVVSARQRTHFGALYAALAQLAEQDPLIDVRQDDVRRQILVSLYGEVQKEVIGATLAAEYGIDVDFRESTTICVERPLGTGAAVEVIAVPPNPFLATVGLTVEPGLEGSGIAYRRAAEVHGKMPHAFFKAVEDTARRTLEQGLEGWRVIDCIVTLTHVGYYPKRSYGHAHFHKALSSTGADFRSLTPLVLMTALARAGTQVCEPMHRFEIETPSEALVELTAALAKLGAGAVVPVARGATYLLSGEVPAAHVHALQQQLPALTRGEGVLSSAFARYRPVRGPAPSRPRTDFNPLNRKEYLLRVAKRL